MAAKWVPLVDEFISVTGASKERAGSLLEACNGNLGMAIEMHFDSSSEATPIAGNSASASASNAIETDKDDDDDVRAPIPQTRGVLVEEPYHTFTTRKRTSRSVFDAFRDFQAEAKQQEAIIGAASTSSLKRKTLQDLFRPPIDMLHKGTFETAKLDGQQHRKWLLVNVQDVKEFACQQLNRDVWSSDAVRSIIKEHFVLWQVYKDSGEGERFIHFYHVSSFPSLTVLDPRTGEKLTEWTGATSPQAFCDCATEFILEHPSFDGDTPPAKKRKRHSIVDASEDSQLQAAIAASLTYTKSDNNCSPSSDEEGDNYDDDDDDDDMGFSDSGSEGQPSPKKPSLVQRSKVKETIPINEETKTNNDSKRTFMGTFPKLASQTDPSCLKKSNAMDPSSDNASSTSGIQTRKAEESSIKKIKNSQGDKTFQAQTSSVQETSNKASGKNEKTCQVQPSLFQEASLDNANSKSEKTCQAQTSSVQEASLDNASSNSEKTCQVPTLRVRETLSDEVSNKSENTPEGNVVGDVETKEHNTDLAKNGTDGERPQEEPTGALCKIMVRFPSGTRKPVSLSAEATIMALVKFVESEGYPNEKYELVTNFPRRKLSYLDFKTTLRAAGLYPQEAVFVQER